MRVLVCAAAAALVLAGVATATSVRVTQGDATAVFQAAWTGGWAVLNHAKVVEGAPAAITPADLVSIRPWRPFAQHYCSLDWHALFIADVEGGDASYTKADAEAAIAQISVSFWLDGQPVAISRTAVKPETGVDPYGLDVAYVTNFGTVLAPSALPPGSHDVAVLLTFAGKKVISSKIRIELDPPGTGVCV